LRGYFIAIALLVAILGSIAAYYYMQTMATSGMQYAPPPVSVGASVAKAATWSTRLDAIGTITAARGVELSSEASGEIIAINVTSGSQVSAGKLLITLNDRVEQASKQRQIANLELAKLLFERDSKLVKQKSIPESQYDRSKADLDGAIAQLAETEARLDNKRVQAPFSGTIGIIHVKVGDYVEPGDTITTLQDLSELEIDFTVPERNFPMLRPGLNILVRSSALPGRELHATLQALDSMVESSTRNLLLRASLKDGKGLLPGMFAELSIDLDNPVTLVTVPETAVSYSLSGNIVYVIDSTGESRTASPRVVTVGDSRDGLIAILDGVKAGETVVSAGQNKLFRGATVTVDESVNF
jgi:membrane fusion protein (multidrug efflux system)